MQKKRPARKKLTRIQLKLKKVKMANKVATTLSIDKDIKMAFKLECIKNGVEMSESVENMMSNYIDVSKQLHKSKN